MPSLILLSSSNALALRPSITTVSTTEMAMATRMPTHSAQSKCPPWITLTTFTATVISQAKKSRMSIGSVDASQMRRSSDLRPVRGELVAAVPLDVLAHLRVAQAVRGVRL